MAGFRDFQTGEVLTAANVNDFLAKQSVMKFADATARDTALGTAVGGGNALREGMVAYLDDEDDVLKYDGSAWSPIGGLVAVKHALKTDTFTASVASGAGTAVPDLSITHSLADSSNKLIISAYLGAAGSGNGVGHVALAVADDGTLIGVGDADGNRAQVGAGGKSSPSNDNLIVNSPAVTFVYSPGDTAAHTFTVRAINIAGGTEPIYVNRTESDPNQPSGVRASSALVIQEVKV